MISFLIFLAVLLTFKFWFGFGPISSGDMGFFYPEQIRQYLNFPFAWETFREAGMGGISFLFQGVYYYNLPMGFLGNFFSYQVAERILWFFPILAAGLIFPVILAKQLNIFPKKFYFLASLIYFLNTYFLMLMGGGQLTVALAYVMIPLNLALFLKVFREVNVKNIIFFSLSLVFLIAWDFRFAYMFGWLLFFYFLFFLKDNLKIIKRCLLIFVCASGLVLGFHAFWILPFLRNYQNPVASFTSAYTTSEAVRFFSFADFPHAFSMLHPNWPENIFGKTYFMQWEFLIIPILAFSSLLFLRNRHSGEERSDDSRINNGFWTSQNDGEKASNIILFFALLGLVGAFLAKGSNEPFGELYLWMFAHVPGFVMFRDPTKFYTLTALSYSILIPYSLWKIYEWLKNKTKFSIFNFQFPNAFLLFAIFYLLFLIRPAWMGQLGGTFKPKEVPREYIELKNFLANQPEFFRTFWIPNKQRFTFYTDNHPAIDGTGFFKVASISAVINQLKEKNVQDQLSLAGVKYVILPFDSEGEIFIKDRIYDDQQRQTIEKELDKISWLKKIQLGNLNKQSFSANNQIKTVVYETPGFKDRFWLTDTTALRSAVVENSKIEWRMINPTKYEIKINNLKTPSILIFSENFDPRWEIKIGNNVISSEKVYGRLNSFKIESLENRDFFVEFRPQKYAIIGLLISLFALLLTLVTPIFVLLFNNQKNKIDY